MNWKPTNEFRWLLLRPPFDGTHPTCFFPYKGARFAQVLQQKWECFELKTYHHFPDVRQTFEEKTGEEWRDVPTVTEESKC